jgi:hypothetical protein
MSMYVAVLGFQGIVEQVSVHSNMSGAMKKIEDHIQSSGLSAEEWFASLRETNDYPDEDYEPTNIYVCDLDE